MESRTDHRTIPAGDVTDGESVDFPIEDSARRLVGIETTNGPARIVEVITKDDNVIELLGPTSGRLSVPEETDLQRGDTVRVRYTEAGTEKGGVLLLRRDAPLVDRLVNGLMEVVGA